MTDNFAKSITEDKSLWEIYKKTHKIKSSRFNFIFVSVFIGFGLLYVLFNFEHYSETLEHVRNLASIGLVLSFSTLGLLTAGFTIFATVSQPDLLIAMHRVVKKDTEVSYLKHNYFVLIRVLIHYLVFAFIMLVVVVFGNEGGLFSVIIGGISSSSIYKIFSVNFIFLVVIAGYAKIFIELKSFIFNLYAATMTGLRWKAEGYE